MRAALPNAAFIGFTGTPLIAGEEERTREVFGDYVSIYDFAQSVGDGATVPLYYENRLPELQLTNEELDDEIARVIDEAELDEDEEDALRARFAQAIPPDHQRRPAGQGRRRSRAAFLRARLSRQGDVRRHRQGDRHPHVRQGPAPLDGDAGAARRERSRRSRTRSSARRCKSRSPRWTTTDMAVVVSASQNEIELMAEQGPRHRASPQADGEGGPRREVQGGRPTRCGSSSSARCGSPASTCRPARRSISTSR